MTPEEKRVTEAMALSAAAYIEGTPAPAKLIANFTPVWALRSGFYLFSAETAAGKSTAALALAMKTAALEKQARYIYMDEAGSMAKTPMVPDGLWQFEVADKNITNLQAVITANGYLKKIKDAMAKCKGGVCVVDSLNGFYLTCSGLFDAPALKGGLVPAYQSITLTLNKFAVEADCALIGVLNSTLFPIPSLEGAAFGAITLSSRGVVNKRDRVDRAGFIPYVIEQQYTTAARLVFSSKTKVDDLEINPGASNTLYE